MSGDPEQRMKDQGVIGVRHFTRKQDGVTINKPTIILTDHPYRSSFQFGPLCIITRIYFPDSLICYNWYAIKILLQDARTALKPTKPWKNVFLFSAYTAKEIMAQQADCARSTQWKKKIARLRFTKAINYHEATKQILAGSGSYAAVSQVQ